MVQGRRPYILTISTLVLQDLQQALGPTVAARMAAAGVQGNVTLISTRTGTDLDPFILVSSALKLRMCMNEEALHCLTTVVRA